MDPGTGLGATGLAIQLFGACLTGYQNLLAAFDMESDLSLLRCRMEIEIQRFKLWGDSAKVSTGIDVPTCHIDTVLSSLRCVEQLFNGGDPIITRYSLDEVSRHQSVAQSTGPIASAVKMVERPMRWILADNARFESTVNNITAINDSLLSLLGETSQREVRRSFQELVIHVLGTDNISKLKLLQSSTADHYSDICVLAALKALKLSMDDAEKLPTPALSGPGVTHPNGELPAIEMPLGDLNPSVGLEVMIHDRQPILLEWRRLPKDTEARSSSISRMRWLMSFLIHASALPNLRALELCGATMDSKGEHMAIVYRHPPQSCGRRPLTLHDLLASPERKMNPPSLNTRFVLAVSLAKALVQLHSCGWLHKSISSRNILFFCPEGYAEDAESDIDGLLSSPFLIGYGYARVEDMSVASGHNAAFSETITADVDMDLYRHPSTFGSSKTRTTFKKTYDAYSLGILLLELALWGSCASTVATISPKNVRKALVDKYLQGNIAYRAGAVYQDVVRTCLVGNFGEPGKEKNWLEIQFMKRVVERLEKCRV
jgi:hypothetical protein